MFAASAVSTTPHRCGWRDCPNVDLPPRRCERCKTIFYCNVTCQKAHWPAHKSVCKPPVQVDVIRKDHKENGSGVATESQTSQEKSFTQLFWEIHNQSLTCIRQIACPSAKYSDLHDRWRALVNENIQVQQKPEESDPTTGELSAAWAATPESILQKAEELLAEARQSAGQS